MTPTDNPHQTPLATTRDAHFQRYPDDEISLIELAKILIKRRWWLIGVFVGVVLASLLYLFLQRPAPVAAEGETRYQYTTYLAAGYKTPLLFIEPLPAMATQIQQALLPQVHQQYPELSGYNVRVEHEKRGRTNDEISNLVEITTLGSTEDAEAIAEFHQALLKPLVERHQRLVETLAQQPTSNSQEQQLLPTEIAALAVQKRHRPQASGPSGPSGKLVLALGIVLGGILGIMAAFFVEFAARVRQSLKEEES
ncbi:Wzz/FepE/Etk N-terminal domain-containing protein [Marinospirillum sp.]|uniref:Wzz/FepE/Etk N-terminal domain-containing protein n=1 Tax=Marinospirillum sp. TaxID=2183934 RepID=UPI003850D6AA